MIKFEKVTLTYPDGTRRITAVDHVSLEVPRGNVTAITGASGSGKSSLLALGSTLIRPDKGDVFVDDTNVAAISAADAARLRRTRIGIVFQSDNLLPSMVAVDQLAVMAELAGRANSGVRKAARERAQGLLESVGLADEMQKRPGQLSGGQRQRINIARALMNDPSLLVVDEPTSALDSKLGAEIIDLVVKVTREHNTATILVTHDRTHLPMMDTVAEMSDGKLRLVE